MPQFKRMGGRIFGVQFSKKEQEAMDKEIRRQVGEQEQNFLLDYDCMVLYSLKTQLGFGEKRLKRFYENFAKQHRELIDYYVCDDDDGKLCRYKLEQMGFDIKKWAETLENGGTLIDDGKSKQ